MALNMASTPKCAWSCLFKHYRGRWNWETHWYNIYILICLTSINSWAILNAITPNESYSILNASS
jgi:hypothetical protein